MAHGIGEPGNIGVQNVVHITSFLAGRNDLPEMRRKERVAAAAKSFARHHLFAH